MLSPLPVGEGEVGVPRVGPHRSPGHPHPIIGHMDKLGRNFKHAGVLVSNSETYEWPRLYFPNKTE